MYVLDCGCHAVDKEGNVYSKWKQFSQKGKKGIQSKIVEKWNKLQCTLNPKSGYLQVNIHGKLWRVNRLIASTFVLNTNEYPECQHINGVRTDNRVNNLKWGNQKHNALDRERHGNTIKGESSPVSKLTDKDVRDIRRLRKKHSLSQLKDIFGVSQKLILMVCQKKIWQHIK